MRTCTHAAEQVNKLSCTNTLLTIHLIIVVWRDRSRPSVEIVGGVHVRIADTIWYIYNYQRGEEPSTVLVVFIDNNNLFFTNMYTIEKNTGEDE